MRACVQVLRAKLLLKHPHAGQRHRENRMLLHFGVGAFVRVQFRVHSEQSAFAILLDWAKYASAISETVESLLRWGRRLFRKHHERQHIGSNLVIACLRKDPARKHCVLSVPTCRDWPVHARNVSVHKLLTRSKSSAASLSLRRHGNLTDDKKCITQLYTAHPHHHQAAHAYSRRHLSRSMRYHLAAFTCHCNFREAQRGTPVLVGCQRGRWLVAHRMSRRTTRIPARSPWSPAAAAREPLQKPCL